MVIFINKSPQYLICIVSRCSFSFSILGMSLLIEGALLVSQAQRFLFKGGVILVAQSTNASYLFAFFIYIELLTLGSARFDPHAQLFGSPLGIGRYHIHLPLDSYIRYSVERAFQKAYFDRSVLPLSRPHLKSKKEAAGCAGEKIFT